MYTKTRTWDTNTPNNGDYIDAEVDNIYTALNTLDSSVSGIPVVAKTVLVRDEKAANTAGGTPSAPAVNIRVLNTLHDPNGWAFCSLSSNQFTLLSGRYIIHAHAPAYVANQHRLLLYNISDAGYVADTEGSCAYNSSSDGVVTHSFLECELTIASTKTFELRHYIANNSGAAGMGVVNNENSRVEVYSQVVITKVA